MEDIYFENPNSAETMRKLLPKLLALAIKNHLEQQEKQALAANG